MDSCTTDKQRNKPADAMPTTGICRGCYGIINRREFSPGLRFSRRLSSQIPSTRKSSTDSPISESSNFVLGNAPVPFLVNFVSSENRTFADIFGYSSKAPEILRPRAGSISSNQRLRDFSAERAPLDHRIYGFSPPASGSSNVLSGSFLNDMTLNRQYIAGQGSLLDATSAEGMSRDLLDSDPLPDPTKRQLSEIVMQLADLYITLPKGHHARVLSV